MFYIASENISIGRDVNETFRSETETLNIASETRRSPKLDETETFDFLFETETRRTKKFSELRLRQSITILDLT